MDGVPERLEIYSSTMSEFMSSAWCTRGWTLQELIALQEFVFFGQGAKGWIRVGSKISLLDHVAQRSGVDQDTLRSPDITLASVARRMSWASERTTTRTEDLAYCLLGIFGVNVPLLYGERKRAFIRLQVDQVDLNGGTER